MRFLKPYLAALFLLSAGALPVVAAQPSAADAARAEHNRVLAYWTPQRMASAQPRDFVRNAGGEFKPAAGRPGSGGGVTGASWPNLKGKISTVEGKVYFSMDGGNWQCSGTTVADPTNNNYSLVLTAGHCTYDETNGHGSLNGFATNWMFMPAWDRQPATFNTACSDSYYGCWTASALFVDSGFANAGGFTDTATYHDWGFIKVGPGGKSNALLESLGTFSLGVGSVATNDTVYAYGFPAAGKYHGNDLTYCSGPTFEDANNSNKTWGLVCDMTGGSSGGGWLDGSNGSGDTGVLGSLNSYGYSGVKNMYGPKFNSNTTSTYSEANSRSASYIVPVSP